jgi:hypothetical protein
MTVPSYSYWPGSLRAEHSNENLWFDSGLIAAAVATAWFDALLALPFVRTSDTWWLAALPIPVAAVLGASLGGTVTKNGAAAFAACLFMGIGAVVGTLALSYWVFGVTRQSEVLAPFAGSGVFGWPPTVVVGVSVLIWAWAVRWSDRSDDATRTARLVCLSVIAIGLGLYIGALIGL